MVSFYLNVVLCELFGQGASSICGRVYCVVDRHLSVIVVQPRVNVLAAFLQDLLAQNDRCRRCVWKEVIVRNRAIRTNSCSTVVSKVKDARFHTEPTQISYHRDTNMTEDL